MTTIQSILEVMTSPFGSDTMKYCFYKVLLQAKFPDQPFFCNIHQRNFDSATQAPFWSLTDIRKWQPAFPPSVETSMAR